MSNETELINKLLELLPLHERRAWVIKIMMESKGINFADVARRHRFTRWYIASAVNGVHKLSPKVVLALEKELGTSIRPLLTDEEKARLSQYEGGDDNA